MIQNGKPSLLIFAFRFSLFAFAACGVSACHTPAPRTALPQVAYANPAQALAALAARRDAVRTVQARAALTFAPTTGTPQSLDAQLVYAAPGQARLRAGKLNQNVLDLTATPEGIWTAVSPRVTDEAPDAEAGLVRLAGALPFLLHGPDYRNAAPQPGSRPGRLGLTWPQGLTAELDAATLTPRRFTLDAGADGIVVIEPVYTLYDGPNGGLPWLRSAATHGPFGRVELTFFDVTLNDTLNPRAFRAPRRATRHPR